MAQDLLIKQDGQGGSFDLVVGEQDFELVEGTETSVAVLLFTDARAAPEEVGNSEKRRGWVGNILRSTELGGMLWLASQVKNTQEIRNKIQLWAEDSLQPLITEGKASEIIVTIGEVTTRGMQLSVEIIIRGRDSQDIDLWLATKLGNIAHGN